MSKYCNLHRYVGISYTASILLTGTLGASERVWGRPIVERSIFGLQIATFGALWGHFWGNLRFLGGGIPLYMPRINTVSYNGILLYMYKLMILDTVPLYNQQASRGLRHHHRVVLLLNLIQQFDKSNFVRAPDSLFLSPIRQRHVIERLRHAIRPS